MLNFIKGILRVKLDEAVVVETGGLGYEIHVPTNSSFYLLSEGDEVTVYTVMIVREDDISLYGFPDKNTLELFRKLITVSGVGARAALSILSSFETERVKTAIAFEDIALLTKANGIGKKTAQRIILDLKDKMGKVEDSADGFSESADKNLSLDSSKNEAIDALLSLGYSKSEATTAILSIDKLNLTTEEYIKEALKRIN